MEQIEIFPSAFISKLEKARNEEFQVNKWKENILKIGQKKSISSLSSNSSVVFLSSEEHSYLLSKPSCVGKQHDIVISKQTDNGVKCSRESFEYMHERLKNPDCVIKDLKKKDIDAFVSILQRLLRRDDFDFVTSKENVTCKTMHSIYGHRKEACDLAITYYNIQFSWER